MIVFLCAHVTISISTYILTSIVIYLPYRLTSSDATRRRVFVYVGKLVGWKTSTFFYSTFTNVFFIFVTFFTFFNVFFYLFFMERFLHLCRKSHRLKAEGQRWNDGALLTYAAGARISPVVVTTSAAVATSAVFNTLALTVKLKTHTHRDIDIDW